MTAFGVEQQLLPPFELAGDALDFLYNYWLLGLHHAFLLQFAPSHEYNQLVYHGFVEQGGWLTDKGIAYINVRHKLTPPAEP